MTVGERVIQYTPANLRTPSPRLEPVIVHTLHSKPLHRMSTVRLARLLSDTEKKATVAYSNRKNVRSAPLFSQRRQIPSATAWLYWKGEDTPKPTSLPHG